MKVINHILPVWIAAIITFSTNAQEIMSIETCREKAIEYNKSLKIANYRKQEAIADQKTARTAYLPKVGAQGSAMYVPGIDKISMPGYFLPTAETAEDARAGNFTGESNVWNPGLELDLEDIRYITAQLGIELPVYAGGKIRYSNKMADLGVIISKQSYQLKYSEVIEQTDQAYWHVVAMKEHVKLADDYHKMLTELEEQITDMYDLGLVPASEKLKIVVQKNEAELGLIRATNGLRLTKMALNQIMGLELNKEFEVSNSLNKEVRLPDFSGGVASALQNRPELNMLKGNLDLSEYNKKMVQADYKPQIGIAVNQTYSKINKLLEGGRWNTTAAAQVSVPVFHWRESKHKKKAAALEIRQTEMELSNTRDLISLEVKQVMIQLEEAWQSIAIAKKSIREANENLEETKLSFEVGLNTTTEVLNAQAEWQKAQTNLIAALSKFEQLKTSWLKVTGKLVSNKLYFNG